VCSPRDVANRPGRGDILDAVGIDLEPPDVVAVSRATRRRDSVFREVVLTAYEYWCAVCGSDRQLLKESVGIEAAHVRWWVSTVT
jgi:putative restriction endonuclease